MLCPTHFTHKHLQSVLKVGLHPSVILAECQVWSVIKDLSICSVNTEQICDLRTMLCKGMHYICRETLMDSSLLGKIGAML